LILTVGGVAQALTLQYGPFFQKTLNYEIAPAYSGGVAGSYYFRDNATSYHTEEHGLLTYGDRVTDGLFSDLTIDRPDGLEDGEDSFGLLRITTIAGGNISPVDSRFGDGSNASLVGNDITAGSIYWAESFGHDELLHGILYGGQDQVVECIVPDSQYRIWQADGLFDIYLVDDPAGLLEPFDAGLEPTDRTGTAEFDGWFDDATDLLIWSGELGYFRFEGSTIVNPQGQFIFDGNTEILADFAANKVGLLDDRLVNWWTAPGDTVPLYDMWQTWNIGDPFVYRDGWTGSEDSGRGFIPVPEPVTMLGVLLGLGSLGGYVRKRQGLI
jgi:hypothetical protein